MAPSFAPLRIDLIALFGLLDGFGVLGLGVGLPYGCFHTGRKWCGGFHLDLFRQGRFCLDSGCGPSWRGLTIESFDDLLQQVFGWSIRHTFGYFGSMVHCGASLACTYAFHQSILFGCHRFGHSDYNAVQYTFIFQYDMLFCSKSARFVQQCTLCDLSFVIVLQLFNSLTGTIITSSIYN